MNPIIITLLLTSLISQVILKLAEDGRLDFTGLAKKYGYNCEEHRVVTEDGYVLKLFHIPGNSNRPILLMHGIIDSADTFMIRGNTSLVAMLANKGFDVWAGNVRGTHYSRTHTQLNPDKDKGFWDFSYHEMGIYDLPKIIDTVLNKTKAEKLNAIGHSQGNTIFYVMGSMKPEYNDKVNILIALGPVGYVKNLPSPWGIVVQARNILNSVLIALDTEEVFNKQLRSIVRNLCDMQADMCSNILGFIQGYDAEELEPEFISVWLGHYPTSTSRKNLLHFAQNAAGNKFCQYDYGYEINMEKYGQNIPLDYDLKKVTMKIGLYGSKNDKLVPVNNVNLLRKELSNVVEYRIMKRKQFNHIDHVWAKNIDKYTFPHLLKLLDKYNIE